MSVLDWVIIGAYFCVAISLGMWLGRRERSERDFFLGGRRIPVWAAALSVVATSLSAVTFLGGPAEAYGANLTYLSLNIGAALGAVLVAALFVPAFYSAGVTSVYQLLGERLGEGAERAAGAMFLVGRTLASGVRLFLAATPVSILLFGDMHATNLAISIAIVAGVATLYTTFGGIGAVIWTDTMQVLVLLAAVVAAIVVLFARIDLSIPQILETLSSARAPDGSSKLTLIDTRLDPAIPNTLLAAVVGFTLFNAAAYGADQDLAQRLLTCKSAARGAWSLLVAIIVGAGVSSLFLCVGLLLWVRDQQAGAVAPEDALQVFLRFLIDDMPVGLRGLALAGLFAAAMSSLDSALNAMASSAVADFYKPMRPGKDERHYLLASRVFVLLAAVVLVGAACLMIVMREASRERILPFALGVMMYAYAGLLGVFLTALCTRRGNSVSAVAALATGAIVVAAMQFGPALFDTPEAHAQRFSFGWRMAGGTVAAFVVCVMGRRAKREAP